jgi:hypothetical protein
MRNIRHQRWVLQGQNHIQIVVELDDLCGEYKKQMNDRLTYCPDYITYATP